MSEQLIKLDNIVRFGDLTTLPVECKRLPVATYMLQYVETMNSAWYQLEQIEPLTLPKKLYGDFSIVDRVLKSFANSDSNIAVGLFGFKGAGKTITAKKLCIDSGMPIIIINKAYSGSKFLDFMSNPALDNCVFFIDEFEKIYDTRHHSDPTDDDTTMLQILDGTRANKKLFVLTSNDNSIGENFTNRLGRVKYRELYSNLPLDTVIAVSKDLLKDIKHLDSVIKFHKMFKLTTFDILVNLINDVNLFDQDAIECSRYLNLQFGDLDYIVELNDPTYSIKGTPRITIDPYDEYVDLEFYVQWLDKDNLTTLLSGEKVAGIKQHWISEYIKKSDLIESKRGFQWKYEKLNLTFELIEQSVTTFKTLTF